MSRYPAEPERLVSLPSEHDLVGVSALLRAAAVPAKSISPAARQRIRGRLRSSLAGRGHGFHHRWRLALTLVFTLAVGGVVGAATHSAMLRRLSPNKGVEPAPARESSGKRRISLRSHRSTPTAAEMPSEQEFPPAPLLGPLPAESPHAAVPAVEASPLEPPPHAPEALSRGASTHSQRPAVPSSSRMSPPLMGSSSPPAAPTDGTRPPAEVTLLAQAIRKLRVDGDASAALSLLDQRQARFTDGALNPEASAVRIEALLRLGRADAALADLDRLPLHTMPRRDEWHVVRGELRAQAGRWSSAESDFATALGRLPGAGGDLAERALWGRAVARSYQGSVAGARADALEYLRRFPSGRFAGLAQRALLAP